MFEPSYLIDLLLSTVASRPAAAEGMQATMQRATEFPSLTQAQLTGIALDPAGRAVADQVLDTFWADQARQDELLINAGGTGEVIVGSGFHAATYAAIRVLSGFPKPLVLERGDRVGGTFAMTGSPTFYLNSRNRPGSAGLAGDQGSSLNYLPGAPIQAANVSMAEYQSNADLAFVIRLALAQFADVLPNAEVTAVAGDERDVGIEIRDRAPLPARRVIDARGVGDPTDQRVANGISILTFMQFMQRMAGRWPLRGLRRVAVVGGGDSGKCVVESLLGIAPPPAMAAAALDHVDRVDWYCETLPDTCDQWQSQVRGRYQAIGRYLRPDRFGVRRLTVIDRQARPVPLPAAALIEGRTYDLVILCTDNREVEIDGLAARSFSLYTTPDDNPVARKHVTKPVFRIGPHAQLSFTGSDYANGIADIGANAVSIFRTATKTAALAATLPGTGITEN
jgi:hypothetical protein